MTGHGKVRVVIGSLLALELAILAWGARDVISGLYDPIIRSLGG